MHIPNAVQHHYPGNMCKCVVVIMQVVYAFGAEASKPCNDGGLAC